MDRRFLSCPDHKEVSDDWWAPGEPDNLNGMQGVAVINVGGVKGGFEDVNGIDMYNVLCQVSNKKISNLCEFSLWE